MTKIIAITNQKGGVAKTTTTLNLGVALARAEKQVLLLDMDPQASLSLCLGIRRPDELDTTLTTVMQKIMENKDISPGEGIIHHKEGIDLMPSNIELSGLGTSMVNVMSREYVLKRYLNLVKQDYDYVLIDCLPSLGMLTVNALVAADSVIIPSQPNFLSVKGLDLLFGTIGQVKRLMNENLAVDGILLTMVDGRTTNAREIIESLKESIGQHVRIFDTQIPKSVYVEESNNEGKSVFAYPKSSRAADAYEKLAKEVVELERQKNRSRYDRVR